MTKVPANLTITRLDEQPALVGTRKQIACAIWMRKEVILLIWKRCADCDASAQAFYDFVTAPVEAGYWISTFLRLFVNNYGWVERPGAFVQWAVAVDAQMKG